MGASTTRRVGDDVRDGAAESAAEVVAELGLGKVVFMMGLGGCGGFEVLGLSVAPGALLRGAQPGRQAQAVVVKVALFGAAVAGRALGRTFYAWQLPHGGVDLVVFVHEPGRTADAVLGRRGRLGGDIGLRIVKWTVVAALGFFGVLALERLL